MKKNNYIGRNIKYFMGDMTEAELSRISGAKAMTIGRVIKGDGSPQVNTLELIANGLNIPITAIMCENELLRDFIVKLSGKSQDDLKDIIKVIKL